MPSLKRTGVRRYGKEKPQKTYGNQAYSFYNSRTWRNTSTIYRTNNPMCEVFPDLIAEFTDHIVPIKADKSGQPSHEGGSAFDERNLMAMSTKAHNKKRGKESHGFVVASQMAPTGLIPKNRQDIIDELRGVKEGA